jgi:hypothetical protein
MLWGRHSPSLQVRCGAAEQYAAGESRDYLSDPSPTCRGTLKELKRIAEKGRGEKAGTDRKEVRMAYYKVRIEVWCDWNPAESDLDEIAQGMGVGEAICTMREVVAVVNRPQDIEDEDASSFFGGSERDADESQG